jgi:glucose dehydrogenase
MLDVPLTMTSRISAPVELSGDVTLAHPVSVEWVLAVFLDAGDSQNRHIVLKANGGKSNFGIAILFAVFASTVGTIQVIANRAQSETRTSVAQKDLDWPAYGGTSENNHYSSLAQINGSNVKQLAVAWSFDTREEGGLQTSPIIVDGVLYGITPTQKVFALDAATGKLLWSFDSGIRGTQPDRGLSYWADGKDSKILVGVMNFLYALDKATGKPIPTFGNQGRIDLRENLGREPAPSQSVYLTSPGTVYGT